tara:strand:+ start:382 stop:585 length:204 start_codon:yes stop_codon:yes gene_type:complete
MKNTELQARLNMLEEINRLKEENENLNRVLKFYIKEVLNLKNQIQESEKLNYQHLETINKIINRNNK